MERVKEPLEADLADSILEPNYLVASTEPASVEVLQLDFSDVSSARAVDQRRAPNPRGCSSGDGVLPPTPDIMSQLPARRCQVRGRDAAFLGRHCLGDRPVTFLNVRLN